MRTFRPAFPNKDAVPVASAAAAEGNVTLSTALTGPAGVPAFRDAFTGRDGMSVTQVTDAEFEDKVLKAERYVGEYGPSNTWHYLPSDVWDHNPRSDDYVGIHWLSYHFLRDCM